MPAPIFNADQLRQFIRLLTGNEATPVTWQVYYDPKGPNYPKRPDLAATFPATLDQALPFLTQSQNNHCGVYIGLNGSDGRGRKYSNIVDFRCVFADMDGITQPTWPATPHFVTQRDSTHGHAFWLVEDITTVDQFRALQYRIALWSNSDTQVTDPTRVVRAPGSLHFKDPTNPQQYLIAADNTQLFGGKKYKAAEIEAAFALTPDKQAELNSWLDGREALTEGSGFKDNEVGRQRLIKFLTVMAEPAVQGSGTLTLIRVAGYGYDQGLPLEVTQDLMWQYYDPRCVPSWASTGEKDHFYEVVGRAYQYARNEPGSRTAVASFTQLPPVPVPPPPPTVQETIRVGDRINSQDAAAMRPVMNAKAPHYDLAKVFDGLVYKGTDLICCEKMFYEFNGRSWIPVSDSVLKAAIQRFYKSLKPADKLTNGIFTVLRDLVNVAKVENGTWLSTGKIAPDVVCFKNGLVDLSVYPARIMPHTSDFFTFNELTYDYDPNAACPNWLKFIADIFDHDPMLGLQLQEYMGYCLVSDVSLQKFAAFIGKSRGGKGTITTVIRTMVGEQNVTGPSLVNLIRDSTLHKMSQASVALIPDAHSVSPAKREEVLGMFKALTGGDPVEYHVMYKGVQTSVFKIKFILSTNGMPEFIDPSGALVNRMLVFPFYKSFAGKEDSKLGARLLNEVAGIAQWALKGLERLRKTGTFTESESSKREKECIAEDMSPLARFIADRCSVEDTGFVSTDDLYRTYLLWARQHEVMHPFSQPKVVREISSSPINVTQDRARIDGKQVRGFKGLCLVRFDPV